MEISPERKIKFYKVFRIALLVALVAVGVSFLTETVRNESNRQENTITFSGHGEVSAVPDIANVYFTISKDSKTVKEAQALVAEIEKKSLDFLKENNVLEKDIKTSNASFYPKYEYKYDTKITMPCTQYNCPPTPGKNVITGYTASESITVKVRNTDDVGKIMQGLGTLGVSDLNGPNFAIDNEDGLKAEARKKAIDNAKEKAEVLAKDLGVRLGKITSFNESDNYPRPMYTKTIMESAVSGAPAPAEIPKGENTISSDVSITYEIR
ncbi:MAG: SIMPL domain-containing protein [Patescibacteria group bacterium]